MKSLARVGFISFILLLGFMMFSFSQGAIAAKATAVSATEAVGQMVWVKGKVEAIDSKNQTRILQRRSPVYEHDTIKTGMGSGQIAFTDNSLVALREGTTFRISEYKFNSSSGENDKYVADVAKGGFRTITGLISKSRPDAYAVRTPVATIGVRGTMFDINYSPTRGLAVKLDKGALFVSNKAGIAELDVAKNRVYSETAGLNVRPAVTTKPSPILKGQPTLTNLKGVPITGGVTKASAPGVVTKVGTTIEPNTSTGSTKTNAMEPIPKGTVKSVTGFCIN